MVGCQQDFWPRKSIMTIRVISKLFIASLSISIFASCRNQTKTQISCSEIPGFAELSRYKEHHQFSESDSLAILRSRSAGSLANHDTWIAFLHKGDLKSASVILSSLIAHPPSSPVIYSSSMDTPFLLQRLASIFVEMGEIDSAQKYLALYRVYAPEPPIVGYSNNSAEIQYLRIKSEALAMAGEFDSAISLLLRSYDNIYNMNQALQHLGNQHSPERIRAEMEQGLEGVMVTKNDCPDCFGGADSIASLKFFGRAIIMPPPDSLVDGIPRKTAFIERFRSSNLFRLATCAL